MEITQSLLKEHFEYKDGFLYRKIQRYKAKVGDLVGSIDQNNRVVVMFFHKPQKVSRLIFMWHHGYMPQIVDHINRNTLDNRIENLRPATTLENNRNSSHRKNTLHEYKGVFLRKENSWVSRIHVNGKKLCLGTYKTKELAALAYNEAAVKYFKEFANLNILKKT